jgi:hypothetical protein
MVQYTHVWNNKKNCGADMTNCATGSAAGITVDSSDLQLGREYFTAAPSPMTAYTYPHPSQGNGGGSSSGTMTLNGTGPMTFSAGGSGTITLR